MTPRIQAINEEISWSMLTKAIRLKSMCVMTIDLEKLKRVKFEAFFTMTLLVFSNVGCSLDEANLSQDDSNVSVDSTLVKDAEPTPTPTPIPIPIPPIDQIQKPDQLDHAQVDALIEKNLREFGAEFSKTLPQPDPIDYERLKFIFQQSLLDQQAKNPENKFQFLCDANERWIYRCNLVTGEIVCYSMGSDFKLKRLDTVEGKK